MEVQRRATHDMAKCHRVGSNQPRGERCPLRRSQSKVELVRDTLEVYSRRERSDDNAAIGIGSSNHDRAWESLHRKGKKLIELRNAVFNPLTMLVKIGWITFLTMLGQAIAVMEDTPTFMLGAATGELIQN